MTEQRTPETMTPEQQAARVAELRAERATTRQAGTERPDDVAVVFEPSFAIFKENKLYRVGGYSNELWEILGERITDILDFTPSRFRPEYVRHRIEVGGMVGVGFLGDDGKVVAGGVIEPDTDDEGNATIAATIICLRDDVDLTDLGRLCEIAALHMMADSVVIWSIGRTREIAGYRTIASGGPHRIQIIAIQPIQ